MSAMPALFVGHGNPMNALAENAYTRGWRTLAASLPRPKAILCVSAHWYVPGTPVTAMPRPRTIHDFGGFPTELFQVTYPAPGDPMLARRIQQLLGPLAVALDESAWGLDHGAWSVLMHLFPRADVPVVELGIDETKPASFHYDVGRRLGALRDEGVLLLGSGNLVHNLHTYAWGRRAAEPFDWALRFEARARAELDAGNDQALVDYEALGQDARLAAPTPDHYLPLLYVLGARRPGDRVTYPVDGVDGGSISMLSVKLDSPS